MKVDQLVLFLNSLQTEVVLFFPNSIEDLCYEPDHIQKVLEEITTNFTVYFPKFIDTAGGSIVDDEAIVKLAQKFGGAHKPKKIAVDVNLRLNEILNDSVNDFYKDRHKYVELLDIQALQEHQDDPSYFKNTILRFQCPTIHHTLQNTQAKELDRYRAAFKIADPGDLLLVITNIVKFALDYEQNKYEESTFENSASVTDLQFSELEEPEFAVNGVIGGGTRSHFLYKLYPAIFPNRSREAVWALWYLTSKKTFGCKEDSEFLMIDTEKSTTQQNYFYPYDLFGLYALQIYSLLKKQLAPSSHMTLLPHRFILVDSFLSYVSSLHLDEITLLKQQLKDGGNEH